MFKAMTRVGFVVMLALCAAVVGCASRPMSVRLNNERWRSLASENFRTGMTVAEVQAKLDELGVSRDTRMEYEATPERGRVLLARSYVGGGAFIRGGDSTLEFNDFSFLFDEDGGLAKVYGFRDSVRYYDGGPAYGPQRTPMRDVPWYPGTIPPPADPLEKATELPLN